MDPLPRFRKEKPVSLLNVMLPQLLAGDPQHLVKSLSQKADAALAELVEEAAEKQVFSFAATCMTHTCRSCPVSRLCVVE